ncbi:hypothetical protein TWF788_000659 [Orbilia oligospora]|uniref:Uncharacterized protein n=1 Tax=Orbilia oligospora TaxID=2813651 RepID=A0A7C8KAH7_ORBOL|nr:hypothetical protein TWF788_000659 [Orbilia oligospora]
MQEVESQTSAQDAEHYPVQSEHWVVRAMKGRIGAAWFCFANFVSFVLIFLVFLGNIYPSTTIFAMISIDLHPQFNKTLSSEIYHASNYTGTNPLTNRIEQPRYLYLGFSGYCNIYDNNSTDPNQYSKECTKSFVQPLLLPSGTLQKQNGKVRDTSTHEFNLEQAYPMWQAAAALMILIMLYNVAGIAVVCAGKYYEFAYKYLWIVSILLSIPPTVLAPLALSKAFSLLDEAQTGGGQCLGSSLFFLAMFLTFVAHPVLFVVAVVIVGFAIAIAWWIISVCCRNETREEAKARKGREEDERRAHEMRKW